MSGKEVDPLGRSVARLVILLICLKVGVVQPQASRPGCPPPIGRFMEGTDTNRVVIARKAVGEEVATVKVRENNYFGSTKCSLVQDMQDPRHTVHANFRVIEGPSIDRVKYCSVRLTATNFPENEVKLTLLLLTDLIPGLQTYCDSPVSSKAEFTIVFCRERDSAECSSRSLRRFQQEEGRTGEGVVRQSNSQATSSTSSTESELNRSLLLILGFIITLIAFSLVLGLIYFWCPDICTCLIDCCNRDKRAELNTTKILTVRDMSGRIIPGARTVEVWRTKENKIKSYNVLANDLLKSEMGKEPKYDRLKNEDGPKEYSDFNSREDSHKEEHQVKSNEVKIVNKPEAASTGSMILVRKSVTPPRNPSRITILEELSPNLLMRKEEQHKQSRVYRVVSTDQQQQPKINVINLDDYGDRYYDKDHPVRVIRINRRNSVDNGVNYSRYYVKNAGPRHGGVVNLSPADWDESLHRQRFSRETRRNSADALFIKGYDRANHQQVYVQEEQPRHHRKHRHHHQGKRSHRGETHDRHSYRDRNEEEHRGNQEERRHDTPLLVERQELGVQADVGEHGNEPEDPNSNNETFRRSELESSGSADRLVDNDPVESEPLSENGEVINQSDEGQNLNVNLDREDELLSNVETNMEASEINSPTEAKSEEPSEEQTQPETSEKPPDQEVTESQTPVALVPAEPLSRRLAKTIGNFRDANRTPSPAVSLTENVLRRMRERRLGKVNNRIEVEMEPPRLAEVQENIRMEVKADVH